MGTKLFQFEGDYYREGTEFISPVTNTRITLAQRKTDSTAKPPLFLLCRHETSEPKTYVSSLYGTGSEGVYYFEYSRARYTLEMSNGYIVIHTV